VQLKFEHHASVARHHVADVFFKINKPARLQRKLINDGSPVVVNETLAINVTLTIVRNNKCMISVLIRDFGLTQNSGNQSFCDFARNCDVFKVDKTAINSVLRPGNNICRTRIRRGFILLQIRIYIRLPHGD
jgi:hypothetical protein